MGKRETWKAAMAGRDARLTEDRNQTEAGSGGKRVQRACVEGSGQPGTHPTGGSFINERACTGSWNPRAVMRSCTCCTGRRQRAPLRSHAPHPTLKEKWRHRGRLCRPQGHQLPPRSETYTKQLTGPQEQTQKRLLGLTQCFSTGDHGSWQGIPGKAGAFFGRMIVASSG